MIRLAAEERAGTQERRISLLENREPLMTQAEAARFCGVTRQTIANWERRELIHRERRGSKTGFLRSELRRRIGRDS